MFVEAHQILPFAAATAQRAVHEALASHAPAPETDVPSAGGLDLLLEVGPGRLPQALPPTVEAWTLEPRQIGQTVVIPLHWEAVGVTKPMYPTFDANIGITPADEQ